MKLSISNIAWNLENDKVMYNYIQNSGFQGIEIAPTRIFPVSPYEDLKQANHFANMLNDKYGLIISSMQSIWYGKSENIFKSQEERKILIDYAKKAIDFASLIKCRNLVFGCPKNRVINNEKDIDIAISFFKELGEYANSKNTVLSIEPNPTIYNTNFINTTDEAFKLVKLIDSEGIMVNVDLGTIICNDENLCIIKENINLVNHIHISEPYLVLIKKRSIHKELADLLKESKYEKFISIEMGKRDYIEEVKNTIIYINEVFR